MRPAAYKMKIEDVVLGQYFRSAEGTEPSSLQTPWGEQVMRVRVMGTIVEKFVRDNNTYAVLRIDDGSETVGLRAWQDGVAELSNFNIGETVDVIGRAREFKGEIYLTPELINLVKDPNWELVRELEIIMAKRKALARGVRPRLVPRLKTNQLDMTPSQTTGATGQVEATDEAPPLPNVPDEVKKMVALAIGKLDAGTGAGATDISKELNLDMNKVDDALRVMFVNGDVFEPASGKFKLTR